jgi:hypothetical protein
MLSLKRNALFKKTKDAESTDDRVVKTDLLRSERRELKMENIRRGIKEEEDENSPSKLIKTETPQPHNYLNLTPPSASTSSSAVVLCDTAGPASALPPPGVDEPEEESLLATDSTMGASLEELLYNLNERKNMTE